MAIPVVDFSRYGLNIEDPSSVSDESLHDLTRQVCEALENDGTMYLVNHGIPQAIIHSLYESSKTFFESPVELKKKYSLDKRYHGWIAVGQEDADPSKPHDHTEAFHYVERHSEKALEKVPTEDEVPNFKTGLDIVLDKGIELLKRFMEVVALGLNLKRDFFDKYFKRPDYDDSYFMLRSCWYPPVDGDKTEVRLGEHTDYGFIIFIFRQHTGLEMYNRKNAKWMTIPPQEGACVITVGDLLQRLTADRFLATLHRVGLPTNEDERVISNQSLVVFGNCDDDATVTCYDGSDTYPPITAGEYINAKMKAIINY